MPKLSKTGYSIERLGLSETSVRVKNLRKFFDDYRILGTI